MSVDIGSGLCCGSKERAAERLEQKHIIWYLGDTETHDPQGEHST